MKESKLDEIKKELETLIDFREGVRIGASLVTYKSFFETFTFSSTGKPAGVKL